MDIETLLGIFGDDLAQSDMLRQSTGDVSELGGVLEGPGGPYDDLIEAEIMDEEGNRLPARLSPGEFVIKADAVNFLGDGDEELGGFLLETLQNNPEALNEVKSVLSKYI
jgi:hypothetical protein